jgi:hypothetical protein
VAAAAAAATERLEGQGLLESAAAAAADRRGARGLGLALGLRIPGRKEAAGEARALIAHAHEWGGTAGECSGHWGAVPRKETRVGD